MADEDAWGLHSTPMESNNLAAITGIVTDRTVIVHPLVLLSVVDHYNRVARGTQKRVVGTLLGEKIDKNIHVTNSFAVPFEEDFKDPTLWFHDHNYLEHMYHMFKKVNAKEIVVGWYSTGPKMRPSDLAIHEIYRKYCPQPIYVIVDIDAKNSMIPTDAYLCFEEPKVDTTFRSTFVHIPSTIGVSEAEDVGVEHLLRDLKNASTSTLAKKVADKLNALKILINRLEEISNYLKDVVSETLPANNQILYNIQDIFNLLSDLEDTALIEAFAIMTNDEMLALYLGSVIRAVMAMHNLINSKIDKKRALENKSNQANLPAKDASKKTNSKEDINSLTKSNEKSSTDSTKNTKPSE